MTHRATIKVVPCECNCGGFNILVDGIWHSNHLTESEANAKADELRSLAGEAERAQPNSKHDAIRKCCADDSHDKLVETIITWHDAWYAQENTIIELRKLLAVSTPPNASAPTPAQFDKIIEQIAELPDRTSPEDWPEAMLVTEDELRRILWENLIAPPAALSPAQAVKNIEELLKLIKDYREDCPCESGSITRTPCDFCTRADKFLK